MRGWEAGSALFFAYVIAVAISRSPRDRLARILVGAAAALGVTLTSSRLPHHYILHDWLLPPILLLLGYWTSGLLFRAPISRQEQALFWLDQRLHIRAVAARMPRWVAEFLEFAYSGVSPLI